MTLNEQPGRTESAKKFSPTEFKRTIRRFLPVRLKFNATVIFALIFLTLFHFNRTGPLTTQGTVYRVDSTLWFNKACVTFEIFKN
jgi:hypothetical protein